MVQLYFDFILLCLVISSFVFLVYGLYASIMYASKDSCFYRKPASSSTTRITNDVLKQKPGSSEIEGYRVCGDAWKFFFSLGNNQTLRNVTTERVLMVISFFGIYLLEILYYLRVDRLIVESDEHNLELVDFTVKLCGLPLDVSEKEVVTFAESLPLTNRSKEKIQAKVSAVNFVFLNLDQLTSIREKMQLVNVQQMTSEDKKYVSESAADLLARLEDSYSLSKSNHKSCKNFSRIAYVSFESEEQAVAVLDYSGLGLINRLLFDTLGFSLNCLTRKRGGAKLLFRQNSAKVCIMRAEQAEDIIWENAGQPLAKRFGLYVLSFLLMYSATALAGVLIAWLTSVQNVGDELETTSTFTSLALSALIIVLNSLILCLCKWITLAVQKPQTKTALNADIAWRSSVAMFLTSTLALVIAHQLTFTIDIRYALWANNGLGSDLWMLVITSCADPFISILDLGLLVKWCKRKFANKSKYSQKMMNELYEKIEFVPADHIPKYLYRMALTLFILRGFPFAALINVAFMVLNYWMDRVWLLKVCKLPEKYSAEMIYDFIRFIEVMLIIYIVVSPDRRQATCSSKASPSRWKRRRSERCFQSPSSSLCSTCPEPSATS